MAHARAVHTATTLPDGRVLLVGGTTDPQSRPEVYDPTTGTLAPTGRLRTPRHSHTATVLPDGRILIAGGYDADGEYLASTERYDSASGTFAPAASMGDARAGHVAVSLPDGRVLVVGGVGMGWTFLASAEVYDPATGAFTPSGPMAVARESHTAVSLVDGRVLVVGGHRGRRSSIELFASAEVYDPVSGRFMATGDMTVRRHKHDAVRLLDGRVLVTGGADERDDRGQYASAELYDPSTGTFSPTGPMTIPHYKHAGTSLVLPDGRVLVAGGAPQAEVYDPVAGTFRLVAGEARMPGQFAASAPLPGGGALVTGGYGGGSGAQRGVWRYRP